MSTPQERETFKRDFGFPPCFKNWGGSSCMSCRCREREKHTGPCNCQRCGSQHIFGPNASDVNKTINERNALSATHQWLDKQGVPRGDDIVEVMTLVQRIMTYSNIQLTLQIENRSTSQETNNLKKENVRLREELKRRNSSPLQKELNRERRRNCYQCDVDSGNVNFATGPCPHYPD